MFLIYSFYNSSPILDCVFNKGCGHGASLSLWILLPQPGINQMGIQGQLTPQPGIIKVYEQPPATKGLIDLMTNQLYQKNHMEFSGN